MLQEFDAVSGCPVIVSTRNKKQRNFHELSRKKKRAKGLKYKAQRLQREPEHSRSFEYIKTLMKESIKLTAQASFIPLYH